MISFFTPQRITILGELKGIVSPSINVLSGLHFILNLQSPFFHIFFFHSSACDESRPAVPLRSSPQKQQQQRQLTGEGRFPSWKSLVIRLQTLQVKADVSIPRRRQSWFTFITLPETKTEAFFPFLKKGITVRLLQIKVSR